MQYARKRRNFAHSPHKPFCSLPSLCQPAEEQGPIAGRGICGVWVSVLPSRPLPDPVEERVMNHEVVRAILFAASAGFAGPIGGAVARDGMKCALRHDVQEAASPCRSRGMPRPDGDRGKFCRHSRAAEVAVIFKFVGESGCLMEVGSFEEDGIETTIHQGAQGLPQD